MVDIKLISYIKEGIKKGYSEDELLDLLEKNGWKKQEVLPALKIVSKENKKIIKKPKKKPEETILKQFIRKSIEEGISETEIRNVLLSKGWKPQKIEESFRGIERPKPKKLEKPIIEKKKEEISKEEKPERKKITPMKIITYLISFIFITLILSGTFVVFFYIQGMNNYSITDSSGNVLKKTCLNEDCSDLKEYALENVRDNVLLTILTSAIIALIFIILHFLLPIKTQLLWIYNILYFLFLGLILFFWIRFQSA
jgi:hypothetical protein